MYEEYKLLDDAAIPTPALVYYKDIISANTRRIITVAGSPARLWPHVKTHKMKALVRMQMDYGICRFKCATIAEAEMCAACGAPHVFIAYPLVGPNIARFIALRSAFPRTAFYAAGDDLSQLTALGTASSETGAPVNLLIDVNMGMDRTGVPLAELASFYASCAKLNGVNLVGLHCYDGHHHDLDARVRCERVDAAAAKLREAVASFPFDAPRCDVIIAGGTPSFPCHAKYDNIYLSPGTAFVHDYGYMKNVPDLECIAGAAVITRVVSHPAHGQFTLDLGSKGISTDTPERGALISVANSTAVAQSEEHWVWRMAKGHEHERPAIGSVQYVLPCHICPTNALYDTALVVQRGVVVDRWEITARVRKISY
ncbi:MAG: D-TA family PLP-dependent enzyme [Oscillospiraceae bacterium]|jgi:D-serine deaminase-like pyridoxal phosphate-dependent protein|nr:D-TA family PLP-dependent enzyme [Oscillospiraceae bacterium]